ncbi:MAG: DUF3857 domain-containing protein [Acidobacteriaceae bacterium]|nr:DUF3857 domain-containing protein [Acidobacteriaceae bacterium]
MAMFALKACAFALILNSLGLNVRAARWRPLPPAQLALKNSTVEPHADAEALFREVKVSYGDDTNVIEEYVRLKIFTENGKKTFGDLRLPYTRWSKISALEARTIQQDGRITELTKDAIFDKVIEKSEHLNIKMKYLAMPAVDVGTIIEYQFKETFSGNLSRYLALDVQSDFPTAEVTFTIKPPSSRFFLYPNMRFLPFGCDPDRAEPGSNGTTILRVRNVPGFHKEPQMPPEGNARAWILIYFEENNHTAVGEFWRAVGRERYEEYREATKVTSAVEALSRRITAQAPGDEDKAAAILNYTRTQLKTVHNDNASEHPDRETNKTPADTLGRKQGTPSDIMFAFVALAQAAGLQARVADMSDRSTFLFTPTYESAYFLNAHNAAVKLNGRWRFYDAADGSLPAGQLRWQEQGVYALIPDPKEPVLVQTPMLSFAETKLRRIADLSLSTTGVLAGEVSEMFSGNKAIESREVSSRITDSEREAQFRGQIKRRLPDAEVTNIRYSGCDDPRQPVTVTYHLSIPNYAKKTGRRMFLMPDVFEVGEVNVFSDAARVSEIYFQYPWSESTLIHIALPDGFVLDHADEPESFAFLPVGDYAAKLAADQVNKAVTYEREFAFGKNEALLFPSQQYAALKKVFDRIHDADNRPLILRSQNTE